METIRHPEEATFHEYLDGELHVIQAAALEKHISACPRCAARLEALRYLFASIESQLPEPLEVDLARHVVEQLQTSRSAWQSPRLAPVVGLQLVLAMLLSAVFLPSLVDSPTLTQVVFTWDEIQQAWSSGWSAALENWRLAFNQASDVLLYWVAEMSQAAATWQEWFSLPEPLSSEYLYGLLAVFGILWLAGNSLLLRAFQPGARSRVQRR